tara:strand:+ start:1561 stop:2121 length:561 start_codon:yes stop_codon:yes gene_type:complete
MGCGKSTVSDIFADNGVPVWDADKEVHRTYKNGGHGYMSLVSLHPKLENKEGIDRELLSTMIFNNEITLKELEQLIHPILSVNRYNFIENNSDKTIIGFDIPLLFETKADLWLDSVLVVKCSKKTQMERLLKRPNMTKQKLKFLFSRQSQSSYKEKYYEFAIDSGKDFKEMKEDVIKVIKLIKSKL